ncbi:hypothetical protein F4859DRAFT_524531 [Xylaria cf. heliscus]|nr:hypothetical protein F4859DRAFT_524531 [Xylaria cf. heliscus]
MAGLEHYRMYPATSDLQRRSAPRPRAAKQTSDDIANIVVTGMAMDPAILKLGNMTANRHKYFRWSNRTAGLTFVYAVVVPFVVGVIAYRTDGKYDLRAKRKGDLVVEY